MEDFDNNVYLNPINIQVQTSSIWAQVTLGMRDIGQGISEAGLTYMVWEISIVKSTKSFAPKFQGFFFFGYKLRFG